VLLLAGLTAACFQPLYGERTLTGGPGLGTMLAAVDVDQIDAVPGSPLSRIAVELRNELMSELRASGSAPPPTHRLVISLTTTGQSIIVDPNTARAEYEVIALNANFRLLENASNRQVLDGVATSRASYVIPGQQQRFAIIRGQRDAQSRAAKVVAEQIRTRLASYFAAGI
jgi:LPS-assembly lipoprotein